MGRDQGGLEAAGMREFVQNLVIAAPAAFLAGVIVGFFVRSKWKLTKRSENGEEPTRQG